MQRNKIVSKEDWLKERRALLKKEKELTRLKDQMSQSIRELSWLKVERDYDFSTENGTIRLSQAFDGRSQLIIYHFMFDPEWQEGCKSCSYIADHYNPVILHLNNRDVSFLTVSRAPIEKITSFKKRMGWELEWVSSYGSSFNYDFHVSFTEEEKDKGKGFYNFEEQGFLVDEAPGLSIFCKDENGDIFQTYSTFSRGLDQFLTTYQYLDLVPKGRDESGFTYPMEWVRHHDRYGDESFKDMYVELIQDR